MPTHDPHVTLLRQRAANLRQLACTIESSLVMMLEPIGDKHDQRARLRAALLERNRHQLYRAADDLRSTAYNLQVRATEIQLARRAVSAA
jgi:hypothetical protein